MSRLEGKVVVITGAESGIGRAMAEHCAAAGAKVMIAALDGDAGQRVADGIRRCGGAASAAQTDVRDPAQIERSLDAAASEFGALDGVIANAGVASPATPFVDLDTATWTRALETNLTGTFLTLQAGARRLIAAERGGALIATGSSTVFRPHTGRHLAYVAAKGGVHAMIRALAMELAPHRVRVNGIAPGLSDTPGVHAVPGYAEEGLQIVPMGELVPPAELGALAAHMLSDDALHMTGSIVRLDAGRTAD